MALQLFDIDQDLIEDPTTKDLKEIYNEEVINQSIDLWISVPYRIGEGMTNNILATIFSDLNTKTEIDLVRDIEESFEDNYQMLLLRNVEVESDPENRRIYVSIDWSIKNFPNISGTYNRYWAS